MRLLPALALALLAVVVQAAPTAPAVHLDARPQLDGQLTEPAWQAPAPIRDFTVLGRDDRAQAPTEAWVGYDADALYVAIKAHEPRMADLKAECQQRDDLAIFRDDVVEVFLDPARDRFHFRQFVCNAAGTQFDSQGDAAGESPEWTGLWQVATARGADSWTAEFRLPFATLGVARVSGKVWGLNVCRERAVEPELSSWAPAGGKFATPQNFGELPLAADLTPFALELAVSDWGQGLFGRNTLRGQVTNLGPKGAQFSLRLEVKSPDEMPRRTSGERLTLAAGSKRDIALDYQFFQAGLHDLTLTVLGKDDRVLAAEGRRAEVGALAQFDVFKSFYRDDVVVRYAVNAPADELERYSLTLQVQPVWQDQAVQSKEVAKLTAPSGEVRLNTAGLARGRYLIHAALLNGAGKAVLEKTLHFPELRERELKQRLVTVRPEDSMLIVQGKPFFPLGLYESPGSAAYLGKLREAGFNLCLSHGLPEAGAKALLDTVYGAGMRLWVPVGDLLDFSADSAMKRQRLGELVARAGDHPGLLCWESIDEPAWGSANAEGLYEGYCHLRLTDQQRPIWTNHAPRNLISTLAYYNRATDVSGCDIYPVPEGVGHSNLPDAALSVVGAETDKNRAALGGDRPVFMVLQGFGWGELARRQGQEAAIVMPTFAQSRFMAYDAIVHGANGVLYWGTHYTRKPSQFWSELRSLVSELGALHDVLAAPAYRGEGHAWVTAPATGVRVLHKRLDTRNFLFVVNETSHDVIAVVHAPTVYAGRLRRLFEGASVPVGPGQEAHVPLTAYGVAVLSDANTFTDARRDFSAEWGNAPSEAEVTAQMTEPGNVLINPGFEADGDEDGLPDRWGSNTPLTAALSETDKHGGKYAVALSSDTTQLAPLLVQRNLDLQAGRKYRLSGWVKSPSPEAEFRLYVEWTLGGKWLGRALPWTKGTGEWQQLTVELTATPDPAGGAYAVVQMRGKGTVLFDDLRVEER